MSACNLKTLGGHLRFLPWYNCQLKKDAVSDGNNAETTRCQSRFGLMITLHKIRNDTKRYLFTDFGQI